MEFIHTFWTTNFPMFHDVEFVYYFLDCSTIFILIECILIIPKMLLKPRTIIGRGGRYDD